MVFAIAAGVQSILSGPKMFEGGLQEHTEYNNYVIFKKSFYHLTNNQDLYISYPKEHHDLFKYTPTFSVFFGLFALLPDWAGLNFWNLLNALLLLFAIYYIPKINLFHKGLISLIVLIELMTSMQNAQSNGMIAGLIVLSFGLLENKKYWFAAFCIVFTFFIKLFGIVALSMLLFYPGKWKLSLYVIGWIIIFALLPLFFIDLSQYIQLMKSYAAMLQNDHSQSYGYSVMGWLYTWFGAEVNKNIIVLIGAFLFLIPFAFAAKHHQFGFKFLVVASILVWIVIFNHKAESPTFIIAMTGVAMWYMYAEKTYLNIVLFLMAFIFTTLSPTDLFPRGLRNEWVMPYALKAFPCILIWFKIIYELLVMKTDANSTREVLKA
jgi:hypothetical protein